MYVVSLRQNEELSPAHKQILDERLAREERESRQLHQYGRTESFYCS